MEHIIQFGIGIDDERIVKEIEKKAEKEIIADLEQKVYDKLFENDWYSKRGDPKRDLSHWTTLRVENFLADHKDEIINMAGKYIAEKLSRTKAVRDLLKEDCHENA